jgi:hypothetical protein
MAGGWGRPRENAAKKKRKMMKNVDFANNVDLLDLQ